jgi:hypothetical protein
MMDNCLLYFLYSIIILSILIIIILSSNLEDNSNTQIISIISTLGLGGLLTLSSKYFSNDYCKDKKTNNSKLGGVINEKNAQLIEQKKSALQKEQDTILIKNQDIFKILKESQVSPTLNKQVDINTLYSSNDQIIEQIYNELFYKNIKSYSIPSNIFPCYKSLLITYISSIKKEVVDKMISSKVKETILKGQPNSTAFSNKKYFLEPNGRNDPIILNPNIFDKTNNDTNNTANLDDFIKYLNTTIKMKDLSYLTAHKTNLSKAYSNIEKFIYNDISTKSVPTQPKEQVPAQEKEQVSAQPKEQVQVKPQGKAKPQSQAKVSAKQRGRGENNIPDKVFSTNYITKNDQNYYIIYNSQLDRSIKYVNQPIDCDLFLKDKTIINSSDEFRNVFNLIHEQNKNYYESLQNIFVLFIFNNNRYIQINENIKNYSQCFEIIGKELQQFQVQISELIRQNTDFNEQIAIYKAKEEYYQEDLTKNTKEHDEKIAQLNLEHDEKIAQLNLEHEDKIAQLTKEHEGKIVQLKKEHSGKIAELKKEHEDNISKLIQDYESQLSKLTSQKILLERENEKSQESLQSKDLQMQQLRDKISSLVTEHKQNLETLAAENTKQIEDIKTAFNTEILQLKELHKKEYKDTFDERDSKDKEYKTIYDDKLSKLKADYEMQLAKQKEKFDSLLAKREATNKSLSTENLRLQKIEQEYNKYNPIFQNIITSFKDQIEYYLNSTLTNNLDLENIKNDYKKEISNLKNYLSTNDNNENIKNQLTELKKIKEYYSDKGDIIMSFGIDEEKDNELLMSISNLKNNINTNIQYDINKLLETHFKVIYFQITLYTNFSLLHNLLLTTNKFQDVLADTEIKITRMDAFKYLDFNSDNNNLTVNVISYTNLMRYYKNLFPNYDKIFGTEPIINITLLNKQPEFKSLLALFKYYIDFYSKTTLLNKDSVQNINNTIKNIEDTYLKETKRLIEREKTLEQEYLSNKTEFKILYIEIANYINNKILKDDSIRKLYINTLVSRKSNNELIQTFINSIKVKDNPPQYIIDDDTPLNYVLELIQFLLTLNTNIIDSLYKKNNDLINENRELFEKIKILELSVSNCDILKQKNTELDTENTKLKSAIELLSGQLENAQKFKNSLDSVRSKIKALNLLKKSADNSNQFNQTDEGDQSSIPENLDIEINQLQEQIDQLKLQLQQLQDQNNELTMTNTKQLQTMDIVTKQLSDAQQQNNIITSLLERIVTKLKETLKINADLKDSSNKEEDIFKFIDLMSKQLNQAQQDNKTVSAQLASSIEKITSLTSDLNNIKQLLFNNFKTIVKLDNDIQNIPTDIYINKIYTLINDEIQKLKQKETDANASNLEKIKTLEADVKQKEELHNKELQKYKSIITNLEDQIKQLMSNQDQLIQKKLEPLIKDYEAKKQEYDIELSKLKQNQWTISTALEDRDKAIANLQNLEAELKEKKTTLQSNLSLIETNSQIIQEYTTEVKKLTDYLKIDTTIQLKDLVKNIIDKLTKYEEQENKLSKLSINNRSLQDQLQAAQQEFSTKVSSLQKEKELLLQELKALKTSLSAKDQKIKELEELQIALLAGNKTLESQLLEKDNEIKKLTEIKNNQNITIQQLSSKLQNNSTISESEKLILKDEIQRLTTVNQTIESRNQDLSSQILELTKQLEQETKDLLRQASDANITNETNINKLQELIKTKSAIIIQLTFKNGKLNKLIDQLQKENKEIKEELKSNTRLLQESKDMNQKLLKNNQDLKQDLELNKAQLEMIKATIETEKSKMQELITKNTNTNTEVDELKKQIQVLTSANLQLSETNTKQESELQSQKIECLTKLDKIKKELDEKISELEELKKQNRTNTNLQQFNKTDSLLKEITELKINQTRLQKEIEELKRQKSEELLQQEIKLKQEINKITKDNEFLQNSNLSNEELNTRYQLTIEKLTQQLTDLQIENARLKTSKDEMIAKELDYVKKLKQTQTDLDNKILELEELKKQKRTSSNLEDFQKASSLLDEIKELKTIQTILEKEVERLKKTNSQEKLQLEITLKKEITKLIKDNEFLKNKNLSNEKSNTQYLTTISDLTKQLAEIQKENGTLQETITLLMSTQKTINKEKETLSMINKDLTIKIEQLNSDITKWKSQLDNQQLQSNSKLRNYKDYILQMQKKHKSQLEILNKIKNETESKLLKTESQLTECNLFKENIQSKLEEMIQTHKNDKSNDTSELERLNKLLNLLRNENERLTMIIEENFQNYNSTYQKLTSQIATLDTKVRQLTSINENMEKENSDLKDNNNQLRNTMELQIQELTTKSINEITRLNQIITKLDKAMAKSNNSDFLLTIKTQLKDLIQKYNNDIKTLRENNIRLLFERSNLSNQIQKLQEVNKLLQSSKIKDQQIRDNLDKELKDEILRLKDFINKKEIYINQLKFKAQSNETNLLNSTGIISQKENEIKKCKLIISQLENSLLLKDEELKRLISQIEELKLKISTLESQITNLQMQTDVDNQTKQSEIDRLNKEISDLQNNNKTITDRIKLELQELNIKYKNQLEECKKQLTDCKQKLDKCEQALNSCQVSLTTCKTDLKDCKDNSDKTISKFQSELDISNAKLSQLEKDKQNLESQLTRLKEILSKSNDLTTTELLKLKESNEKLLSENKKLKETKPIINTVPISSDDIQVIYKYVEKPANTQSTTKFNNAISNTAFDKFIMNNSLIY